MLEQMINKSQPEKSELLLLDIGRTDYDYALELQDKLVELKLTGLPEDFLIITEHNPVITLGKSADESMLKLNNEEYEKLGINLRRVDRGGFTTYHGPGQIVGYPIIDLEQKYKTNKENPESTVDSAVLRKVGLYKEQICDVMLETIRNYHPFNKSNTENRRGGNFGGIWYTDENGKQWKIGARGIKIINNKITKHGFALDVLTPSFYRLIKPCGHEEDIAKSMQDFAEEKLDYEKVKEQLICNFAEVLGYELKRTNIEQIAAIEQIEKTVGRTEKIK